jgi:hypothetical protein
MAKSKTITPARPYPKHLEIWENPEAHRIKKLPLCTHWQEQRARPARRARRVARGTTGLYLVSIFAQTSPSERARQEGFDFRFGRLRLLGGGGPEIGRGPYSAAVLRLRGT